MSKKIKESELEILQDLLNNQAADQLELGKAYHSKSILEARIHEWHKSLTQAEADFNKYIAKLKKTYGNFSNINLSDGSIQEIENNEQSTE